MQKISSSTFTYFFLAIASLLFLATGILGAITIANIYSYGFEVLISDSYSQAVFSSFAALSIVSVYAKQFLDSYKILYLEEEKIETKSINLVPVVLPVGISLPDKSYYLKEIVDISSNRILKSLVKVTFAENREEKTVKSFVKLNELPKLKALVEK
jgi:hypothetical protein